MSIIAEKFLSKIPSSGGRYAFRGQEYAEWALESSAVRRLGLSRSRHSRDIDFKYHRDELIVPARKAGFGLEDGRELTDLQLLAKLRHFGAAAGLTVNGADSPIRIGQWSVCKYIAPICRKTPSLPHLWAMWGVLATSARPVCQVGQGCPVVRVFRSR